MLDRDARVSLVVRRGLCSNKVRVEVKVDSKMCRGLKKESLSSWFKVSLPCPFVLPLRPARLPSDNPRGFSQAMRGKVWGRLRRRRVILGSTLPAFHTSGMDFHT
ncbi:unnamed protein product [Pleuronectes platessa]|uniref:Uncharacterized protein n=1 Tax=Pleuronectes platessa TaxID=8262 RepID=A0A9N7U4P6_PLEPL|nr:unnamed protein product [Pleuronectes platessa]